MELIKLAPYLRQTTVSSYIELHKVNLLSIRNLVLHAHGKTSNLSVEGFVAIAFASVLFGGSVWASLPKMFDNIESAKLECVLGFFEPLLYSKFSKNLAKWFRTSWKYIEE